MEKHKCIYCLKEKNKNEFNTEHVFPRMFGTYNNNYVLNNFQVCEECNTYFNNKLESKSSLNSFESYLRMLYGKKYKDGVILNSNKIWFKLEDNSIFSGALIFPTVDKNTEIGIKWDFINQIGIFSQKENKYIYYLPSDIPQATKEIISFLKITKKEIIFLGTENKHEYFKILQEKGYTINKKSYNEQKIEDYRKDINNQIINIRYNINKDMRRLITKIGFNYMCYHQGVKFTLNNEFDDVRNFIRCNINSDKLWFKHFQNDQLKSNENDHSNKVGCLLCKKDNLFYYCGYITFFGILTYIFNLSSQPYESLSALIYKSSIVSIFDNENYNISTLNNIFVDLDND